MANSIWHDWISNQSWISQPAKKRVVRDARHWMRGSEQLEDRALLSAMACDSTSADVAHAKAAFEYPNVAGTWDVTVTGLGEGTAVITQDGKKVTSVITVQGFPEIEAHGKFTKKEPHSISGKTKLTFPEIGKVIVHTTIEWPEESEPATFTGEATLQGESFGITGEKQAPASLPTTGKAAPEFHDVTGAWIIDAEGGEFFVEATGEFTQDGKGGKAVHANLTGEGVTVAIDGKFNKKDDTELKGKAVIVTVEGTVHAKFTVNYDEAFDTFDGTAQAKGIGEFTISGERAEA